MAVRGAAGLSVIAMLAVSGCAVPFQLVRPQAPATAPAPVVETPAATSTPAATTPTTTPEPTLPEPAPPGQLQASEAPRTNPAPAPAPTTRAVPQGEAATCTDADLDVDARGQRTVLITITNIGSSPCRIKGFPGADFYVYRGDSQAGMPASRESMPANPVVLAPGAKAYSTMTILSDSGCSTPLGTGVIGIIAPNTYQTHYFDIPASICQDRPMATVTAVSAQR